MTDILRLLPLLDADGPTQMAADDALLHSASTGVASMRFYTWRPATLSLGYFQPAAARLVDPLLAAMPWVRRPSGGGAIVHHHELTYAIALPAGERWQPRGQSWLCRMHHLIVEVLQQHRVPTDTGTCGVERRLGDFLCFEHHTPGDVLIGEHKIVGSAQRRYRGATLQHGSILLAQSEFTPSLPGLLELAQVDLSPELLAGEIVDQLQRQTNWDIKADEWSQREKEHLQAQRDERFTQLAWNERR